MAYGIVYKAINLVNGKVYIGQTTRPLGKRISAHRYCPDMLFSRAMRKYGHCNFKFTVIDHATDRDDLNNKERFWIRFSRSMAPNGYNFTSGGDSLTEYSIESRAKISFAALGNKHCLGITRSAETRSKMSAARKGMEFSIEHRTNISASLKGKQQSPDAIVKRAASNTGKKRSTAVRASMSGWKHSNDSISKMLGRKCSPETRAKMSAAKKGKEVSAETRTRLSRAGTGKKLSLETRYKMSESQKARRTKEKQRC